MSINCDICDYKINTINIVIKCPYCSFECCHRCTAKYLLMNSQAHCMSCKELWNDDFLYSSLSPKFLNNEYKKHNTGIIFEQEKSMMPETMVIINNMKRIDVSLILRNVLNSIGVELSISYFYIDYFI